MSKGFSAKVKEQMQRRLADLMSYLKKDNVDAFLVEDPKDLFYFTGQNFSMGRLWVGREEAALFVDARYIESAQRYSFIQPSILLSAEREKEFLQRLAPHTIAFDGALLSFNRAEALKKMALDIGSTCISKEGYTSSVRMVKTDEEIKKIRASASLLKKVYKELLCKIKTGMTEKDVAMCFEILLRQMGAEAAAFEPIVAFGANSAMPHHRAGDARLKTGQIILLDLGLIYGGYHSDMTRLLFHGRPDAKMLHLCAVVKRAHSAAVALCQPGQTVAALDIAARDQMRQEDMEPYFTHSLGHGIGLDTHERPRVRFDSIDKDLILQPGMVITIEPGLYLPGIGGVRWEDMILITDKGHVNLTKGV